MRSALGMLKWPPDQFWRATPAELDAAMDGHLMTLGVDPDEAEKRPVMSRTELFAMIDRFGDASPSIRPEAERQRRLREDRRRA